MAALEIFLTARCQEFTPHIALEVEVDILPVELEAGTVTGAGSAIRHNTGGRNITAPIAQVVAALAAGNAIFKISQDDVRY